MTRDSEINPRHIGTRTAELAAEGKREDAWGLFFAPDNRVFSLHLVQLQAFVSTMLSGAVGRRSLGSFGKRLVREWFERHTADLGMCEDLAEAQDLPSLGDIIRAAHVQPPPQLRSLFAVLVHASVQQSRQEAA